MSRKIFTTEHSLWFLAVCMLSLGQCTKQNTRLPGTAASTQGTPPSELSTPPQLVSFYCEVANGKLLSADQWLAPFAKSYLAQHSELGVTTVCSQQMKGAAEGLRLELMGCLWNIKTKTCWVGNSQTLMTGEWQTTWTVPKKTVRELLATPIPEDSEDDTIRYTLRLLSKEGKVVQQLEDTITYRFPLD